MFLVSSQKPDLQTHPIRSRLAAGPGSVRLPFVHGTVRAVLVFGSDGSSLETDVSLSILF